MDYISTVEAYWSLSKSTNHGIDFKSSIYGDGRFTALEYHHNGIVSAIVWEPNNVSDIGEWSICGGDRLHCLNMVELWSSSLFYPGQWHPLGTVIHIIMTSSSWAGGSVHLVNGGWRHLVFTFGTTSHQPTRRLGESLADSGSRTIGRASRDFIHNHCTYSKYGVGVACLESVWLDIGAV